MEGLVILILTLAAFVAAGIYVVVRLASGPKLPKGIKFETTQNNNRVIVIVDEKLEGAVKNSNNKIISWIIGGKFYHGNDLAQKCALAVRMTEAAFIQKGVQKADAKCIIVLFSTDETFETGSGWWQAWSKGASAYSTSIAGIFGTKKTPMTVIRTKYLPTVIDKGQPLIHELVHILNEASEGNYNHNHSDAKLWLGPGGKTSIEGISVQKWNESTGTISS